MENFKEICSVCHLEFSTDLNKTKTDSIYARNGGDYICHSCVSNGMVFCNICGGTVNKIEASKNRVLLKQLAPFESRPINQFNSEIDNSKQFCTSKCYNLEMIDNLSVPYNMILEENVLGFDNSSNSSQVEYAEQSLKELQFIKDNLLK